MLWCRGCVRLHEGKELGASNLKRPLYYDGVVNRYAACNLMCSYLRLVDIVADLANIAD